ncbi:hypothetical protein ACFYTQ_37030 [Nocardia sp. NPDC004068]|uniref:hypothetical protein n=1 Tax=Nocardia sp. NPDC004068 TaxID=3364303 RepID=UPI0036A760F5
MTFEVNPDGLRAAGGALALLPTDIDNAPKLDAEPVATSLAGLTVGAELAESNAASTRAKELLKARFNEFSALLVVCADNFHGSDQEAAQRIAAVADLNSGDPHSGR